MLACMQPSDGKKIGPLAIPADPKRLAGWMVGNATFAFFVYWTADSFFPGREMTAEAMLWKLGTAAVSFAIGLWLMHINHD
jgi:hypothetical protein